MSLNEHETAFIDAFLIRDRRDRYRSQLASRKKRGAFLDRLNHRFLNDVDERWIVSAPSRGLPEAHDLCYLIACEDRFDRQSITVADFEHVVAEATFGLLVSFIPGKLVAYKDEAPASVVWMSRN